MIITTDILKAIAPGSRKTNYKLLPELAHWMNEWFPKFDIDTLGELRHSISQFAHESDSFNSLEEYASGKAYEGRKDLGNVVKGDGERYKGRGLIMTTGRTNYLGLGQKLGKPNIFLDNPELLENPSWAVWSAYQFWNDRDLSTFANMPDSAELYSKRYNKNISPIEYISIRINGGWNGILDRKKFYERAKQIIQ